MYGYSVKKCLNIFFKMSSRFYLCCTKSQQKLSQDTFHIEQVSSIYRQYFSTNREKSVVTGEAETEMHFLLICDKYNNIRA